MHTTNRKPKKAAGKNAHDTQKGGGKYYCHAHNAGNSQEYKVLTWNMKWHFVVVVRYVLYLTERHKKSTLQKNKKTAHTERKNKNSDQANKKVCQAWSCACGQHQLLPAERVAFWPRHVGAPLRHEPLFSPI